MTEKKQPKRKVTLRDLSPRKDVRGGSELLDGGDLERKKKIPITY